MEEDFAQWYTDVVKKAELIDYSSVKGCMIIKPAGYAIWENIHKELDRRFKETGVENVYMPLFIPESLLENELAIPVIKGQKTEKEKFAGAEATYTILPYAMGRIIDIESFLQDYPCDPDGGTLYIELEIEDHLLSWNNRSFRLCFSDGTCMLTDEPAEYKLKMEIGTLTTLLLVYKTAERLYALERIEGKQEAVDRLDDVLFHKIPYISDYI